MKLKRVLGMGLLGLLLASPAGAACLGDSFALIASSGGAVATGNMCVSPKGVVSGGLVQGACRAIFTGSSQTFNGSSITISFAKVSLLHAGCNVLNIGGAKNLLFHGSVIETGVGKAQVTKFSTQSTGLTPVVSLDGTSTN